LPLAAPKHMIWRHLRITSYDWTVMTQTNLNDENPHRVAWITGAGSGVGAAAALGLAARGTALALSGRRRAALEVTRTAVHREYPGHAVEIVELDVTDELAIDRAHDAIVRRLGPVDCLVLSAGLNTPRRYWRDMTPSETRRIVETNLLGPASICRLVLPGMRTGGNGTIVIVSSLSAWRHSPDAGVAYSASKLGVGALVEHLNTQEARHGIRASTVSPGDINTDFLSMRPSIPGTAERSEMLSPEEVARAILFIIDLPRHICIDELVVTPVKRSES